MDFSLHGANYEKLYKQYNIEMPQKILDFSTNTNVVENLQNVIDYSINLSEYPDDNCTKLCEMLANREGVKPNQILIVNGSNEAIYLIASRLAGKRVGIIEPTYPEYRRALVAYGAEITSIDSVKESSKWRGCECVFLCNPNNPTGSYMNYDSLYQFAKSLDEKGIQLVVDEAYIDFLNRDHNSLNIEGLKGVYILRSLTKTYQLAGIRIGYVLSYEDNIKRLKERQPTWSVNGLAQELAIRYLEDWQYLLKTRAFYNSEVDFLREKIKALGYRVLETDVNFFLIRIYNDESLIKFMLRRGIVIRHTRNHIGLDGDYVRVAVRTRAENLELLEGLVLYENISD